MLISSWSVRRESLQRIAPSFEIQVTLCIMVWTMSSLVHWRLGGAKRVRGGGMREVGGRGYREEAEAEAEAEHGRQRRRRGSVTFTCQKTGMVMVRVHHY